MYTAWSKLYLYLIWPFMSAKSLFPFYNVLYVIMVWAALSGRDTSRQMWGSGSNPPCS